MPFDKDAYRDGYLRPKTKLKLTTLQDDLFDRYAITLPARDADVVATVNAVRSFWSSQQRGAPLHRYAAMCQAADEELRQQKVAAGPHRGKDMLTAGWWEAKREEADAAAQTRISELAAILKDSNGAYGVVTRSYLATCAERLALAQAQAEAAAKTVGLEVVDDVDIPDGPPVGRFAALEQALSVGQVATVPTLIHPRCAPFRIASRFESPSLPSARLDIAGVRTQELEANRQPNTATWNARRSALNMLRSAAEGGADLHQVALYHLVKSATGSGVPGTAGIRAALLSRGVEERDANILAVVLADRAATSSGSGVARAEQLLQEGRLREAISIAQSIPQEGGSDQVKQLLTKIGSAKGRLEVLLAEADALLAVPDEIGSAAKLREAASISAEDAAERMALVPLSPVRELRAEVDGGSVRLHWQPNVGHDSDTGYTVVRSADAPPKTPANGTPLPAPAGTSATDAHAPVARTVHYSVFATTAGRPSSRPVTVDMISLPPVADVRIETGADWVSAHWSAHPGVHHVEATRNDGATATAVPVQLGGAKITGLPEGESVHIELVAVYQDADGRALRSTPVTISGTPRAAAKPLENLRAQPIAGPSGVQVRLAWTAIDRSEVRLKRNVSVPRWNSGQLVTAEDMAGWGTDITGQTDVQPGRTVLEASLPPGVHHVVPFSIGGTGIITGRPVSVGVTEPVTGLSATLFHSVARLAWTWPGACNLAEVGWQRDDAGEDAVGLVKLSRAEYDTKGITVPLGPEPCEISVRALIFVAGRTFASPPVTVTVDRIATTRVDYKVSSSPGIGPIGGRTKKVTVTAGGRTGPLKIALVAAPGTFLPATPDAGVTIHEENLTLDVGQSHTFSAKVPPAISKPYWVRCFLISGNAQLHDPLLTTLKEG
jgi:hypothetical protein